MFFLSSVRTSFSSADGARVLCGTVRSSPPAAHPREVLGLIQGIVDKNMFKRPLFPFLLVMEESFLRFQTFAGWVKGW